MVFYAYRLIIKQNSSRQKNALPYLKPQLRTFSIISKTKIRSIWQRFELALIDMHNTCRHVGILDKAESKKIIMPYAAVLTHRLGKFRHPLILYAETTVPLQFILSLEGMINKILMAKSFSNNL